MKNQRLRVDIIAALPAAILEAILCLVPTKDATRTSILSKEWRRISTRIPKLVFILDDTYEEPAEVRIAKTRGLLDAMNRVLALRQAPVIDFTLEMDANDDDTRVEVEGILTDLFGNNMLGRLSIDLTHGCRLPLEFFSLSTLTDLHLRNCDIHHPMNFNRFDRLTNFRLHDVNILTNTLLGLLRNCRNLKTFTLLICQDNILSHHYATMIELFECLPRIEHFTSWGWLIPCFAWVPVPRELPTPLVHLKSLCLDTLCFLDASALPFVIMLIRSSPNLEKLKLEAIPQGLDEFWEDDLNFVRKKWYYDVWFEHLNEFEIGEFSDLKPESDFVKLILAKSPVLKKARIIMRPIFTKNEEKEIVTALLRSPHSSSEVDIIFEHAKYGN